MKKQIKKNIKQRYLFKNFEKKRIIYKVILKNINFEKNIRWKIYQKLMEFQNNTSLTRIKNICILTGRTRSVYRFFKLSRLQFQKLTSFGFLPGFSKYSW